MKNIKYLINDLIISLINFVRIMDFKQIVDIMDNQSYYVKDDK